MTDQHHRILVTGANGFIGREVCRVLIVHGYHIVATDRNASASMSTAYPFVEADVCDVDTLSDLCRTGHFDAIIHLASMRNRESQTRPADALRVNIGASLTLLDLAAQYGIARFVYGSSISAYGPKPTAQHGEVAEIEPAAPGNVYGLGKRYVEMAGEQLQRTGRLAFVALRIAMVVGAGVVSTASMWRGEIFERLPIAQPCTIHLPYARDEVLPLIHVSAAAEMLHSLAAAAAPRHTIYNTPAEHWTCSDLANAVAAINPSVTFTFVPSGVRGDPEKIDGRRFQNEMACSVQSIHEQMRLAIRQ